MRHEEDDYDNDDFVVDDEEEPDWRQALKSVTRYDPSKYAVSLMLSSAPLHHFTTTPVNIHWVRSEVQFIDVCNNS